MSIASSYAEASTAYSSGVYQTFFFSIFTVKQTIVSILYCIAYNLTQQANGHHELFQTHVDQWRKIWDSGNILMEGPNLELV